jgi:integrase
VTVSAVDRARRPKRGHGEGSIYQRPDGTWAGSIMLGRKPNGKADRPKVYGKTRGEVQRQLAKLRREADEGRRADPSKERQTVASFLQTWLDAARTSTRERSHDRYRDVVRLHLIPTLGRHKLSALRPDAIQSLYAAKLTEGLAPGTVEKIHNVLHRALEMAVKWRYLSRNPADDVDKPTVRRGDIHPPEPSDLTRLVDAAEAAHDRLAPLWALAIYTGCRQGELLGLDWQDVDLERGTLTVRRCLTRASNHVPQFGLPKSDKSRRTVSLPAVAVAMLRAHKARQAEERLTTGPDWADDGLVFTTRIGTPLIRRNVLRDFHTAPRRAGLRQTVRFHDLRHAHATLMLRAGVPLKVASGRLGHSSIGITADLYQHIAPDMDADAAERAAAALLAGK